MVHYGTHVTSVTKGFLPRRGVAALALTAIGLAAHGCGGGGGGTVNQQAVKTIIVRDDAAAPMGFAFESPVTVTKGTVVRWSNISSTPHGIIWDTRSPGTSPPPGADVPTFASQAFSSTWTAPDVTVATTYNYFCTVHGPTMAGVINVTP